MVSGPHPQFPHLFEPLELNGVTLRNRVAISGHLAGWYVGPGGLPSDELAAYIAERGRGGVGLFVIGSNVPTPGHDWIEASRTRSSRATARSPMRPARPGSRCSASCATRASSRCRGRRA